MFQVSTLVGSRAAQVGGHRPGNARGRWVNLGSFGRSFGTHAPTVSVGVPEATDSRDRTRLPMQVLGEALEADSYEPGRREMR